MHITYRCNRKWSDDTNDDKMIKSEQVLSHRLPTGKITYIRRQSTSRSSVTCRALYRSFGIKGLLTCDRYYLLHSRTVRWERLGIYSWWHQYISFPSAQLSAPSSENISLLYHVQLLYVNRYLILFIANTYHMIEI